jgi:hypothetical protein
VRLGVSTGSRGIWGIAVVDDVVKENKDISQKSLAVDTAVRPTSIVEVRFGEPKSQWERWDIEEEGGEVDWGVCRDAGRELFGNLEDCGCER